MRPTRNMLAATILACGAASPALAQCSLYRWFVPDFDQKRDALPGNGGMYCVPTSAVNWMAYIANHGYGPMMSGPRNWQSQSNYGVVTSKIEMMGILMGTSASGGTGGDEGLDGLRTFMFANAPFQFSATVWYGNITPQFMHFQMATNGLVNICYGYYDQVAGPSGNYYVRDGGHCVTLNGVVDACSVNPKVRVRNPADDGGLLTQSVFATAETRAISQTFASGPLSGMTSTLTRLADFAADSTTRRYVDTMYVIRSSFACWSPASPTNQLVITRALSLFGDPQPHEVMFNIPAGAVASAVAVHPDQTQAAYVECRPIVGGTGGNTYRLHLLNLADGSDQDLGLLLPAVQSKTPITFDRFGRLVYCDGSVLKVMNLSGRAPQVVAMHTLASPASSVCFDDALDEVVVLTPGNRRLIRFTMDLASNADEPVPNGVPAMGDGSVIPDPTTSGHYLLCIPGNPSLFDLALIPGTPRFGLGNTLLLPAVQSIQDVQPADGGAFAMCDGSVRVLDRDPTNGRLRLSPIQPFGGMPAMRCMSLSRSRTNFDPALHDGPAWVNLPDADEGVTAVPDCPADYNLSGEVSVQDIFDFLAGYFGNDPHADVNDSLAITVQDIFDFLAAYFAGCP